MKKKKTNINKNEPIFIVGMQRTGSTLLKSILNSHPAIAIPRETNIFGLIHKFQLNNRSKNINLNDFWNWYKNEYRYKYLNLNDDEVESNFKKLEDENIFRKVFEAVIFTFLNNENKIRWGDKTPGHELYLDKIFNFYPNSKIIYLLRDPRSVYSSLKRVDWNDQPLSVIIKQWNLSVKVLKQHQKDPRVILLKYEDLINETEQNVKLICNFIGEEYVPDMIFNRKSTPNPIKPRTGFYTINRPIDSKSLDIWKKDLTNVEISLIEKYCDKDIFKKNYKYKGGKLNFKQIIKYYNNIIIHKMTSLAVRFQKKNKNSFIYY